MEKQKRKCYKLLETLDKLDVFNNHDKNVIRLIANYGKGCRHVSFEPSPPRRSFRVFQELGDQRWREFVKCRGCGGCLPSKKSEEHKSLVEFDETSNTMQCSDCCSRLQFYKSSIFGRSTISNITIDQFNRLWIAFEKKSCELDVYDLMGHCLFRLRLPNISSANSIETIQSIKAVNGQLVICQSYPPTVLILDLTFSPSTIAPVVSFDALSMAGIQNWFSWFMQSIQLSTLFHGYPKHDYLHSQVETATICRKTKEVIVAFHDVLIYPPHDGIHIPHPVAMDFNFRVYSQTGVFIRSFKIQTSVNYCNRIRFDNNEDQILIINFECVRYYDFHGNEIFYDWDDNSAFHIEHSHPNMPVLSNAHVVCHLHGGEIIVRDRDDVLPDIADGVMMSSLIPM